MPSLSAPPLLADAGPRDNRFGSFSSSNQSPPRTNKLNVTPLIDKCSLFFIVNSRISPRCRALDTVNFHSSYLWKGKRENEKINDEAKVIKNIFIKNRCKNIQVFHKYDIFILNIPTLEYLMKTIDRIGGWMIISWPKNRIENQSMQFETHHIIFAHNFFVHWHKLIAYR